MPKAKPIPEGMTAVTPHIVCKGVADALEFYKRAFGAEEEMRLPAPDGTIVHAQMRIGGAPIMLGEAMPHCGVVDPKGLKGSPVTIHLYVGDVDATAERAVKAGAKVTMPVAEQFWGDRYGQLEDPFGHRWSIATHVRDVSEAEMAEAMKRMPMEA
jgi:PhnB protein